MSGTMQSCRPHRPLSPQNKKFSIFARMWFHVLPDSQDFQHVAEELRAAIHAHLEATRGKLTEMALRARPSGHQQRIKPDRVA